METSGTKLRARVLAGTQAGRITYAQLRHIGLTAAIIRRWIENGTLTRTLPRVYALGYVRTDSIATIWDAILYAGPGAYLTGASGAHARGLINYPPGAIKVATPRQCKSQPGIIVLKARPAERQIHKGIPVAQIPQLMLELAAEGEFNLLRKAIANLDYRRQLDLTVLLGVCVKGRRGSQLLRRALAQHLPQLAYTNGPLEEAFVILLDARHLPLPRCNVRIHGILVDAYWPALNLVVELDGLGNHGTAAQKRRDANRVEVLRSHGIETVSFDSDDVHVRKRVTLTALACVGVR